MDLDQQVDASTGMQTLTVRLTGELSLAEAAAVEEQLDELLDRGFHRLTIDLAGVSFIDSSGLGLLVRLQQRAGERGIDFGISGPTAQVYKLLRLTGLERLLMVEEDHGRSPA